MTVDEAGFSARSAVIFGGSGFIGTHLARRLAGMGIKVTSADLLPPRTQLPGQDWVECDVRKPIALTSKPDVVFNLAAVHRTPGHPDHEYYDTNVHGAINVARWCEQVGVERLAFTSSISVYGPTEVRRDESSQLTPNSAYGRSKLMAEEIHRDWHTHNPGSQLVIARPAVVFGEGEHGNFTRIAGALKRNRFAYPGRDDTIKSCGYVGDLVEALLFMLELREDYVLFNYCYPDSYSIKDVAEAFNKVAGYKLPVKLPAAPMNVAIALLDHIPGSSDKSVLNPQRLRKLTSSTNIWPGVLLDRGFKWSTDLTSALEDWLQDGSTREFL